MGDAGRDVAGKDMRLRPVKKSVTERTADRPLLDRIGDPYQLDVSSAPKAPTWPRGSQ
jgi:hypothetical protein